MANTLFLAMKKLTGQGIIRVAAKHNHRELMAEVGPYSDGRIDPNRTYLNYVLAGPKTAAGIVKLQQDLIIEAEITTLRKDAVQGLELIFSLPPDTAIDHRGYFEEATKWTQKYFGVPLLSSIVHLDESAPHCHVILLPLVGGRMNGSAVMGNARRLQTIQSDFHEQVAQRYGLTRKAPVLRLSGAAKREAATLVLNAISENPDLLNSPDIRQALITAINQNIEPLARALGLGIHSPTSQRKTFVGIMTKPVKPEKTKAFSRAKPIGFLDGDTDVQLQNLSCVGFDQPPSNAAESKSQTDAIADDSVGDDVKSMSMDPRDGAVPFVIPPFAQSLGMGNPIIPRYLCHNLKVSETQQAALPVATAANCRVLNAHSLYARRPYRPLERSPPEIIYTL